MEVAHGDLPDTSADLVTALEITIPITLLVIWRGRALGDGLQQTVSNECTYVNLALSGTTNKICCPFLRSRVLNNSSKAK